MSRAKAAQRTLRHWLRDAARTLESAGIASPRHDAERIAAHVLGVSWGELWLHDRSVEEVCDALDALLARRAAHEPLAYVLGSAVFYGHEIGCGRGVLVPRPETETLVDVALELVDGQHHVTVVDIGCGSGAIAIAIAHARPDARVIATDVSDEALAWARTNAEAAEVEVSFRRGDLFDALGSELRGEIDLVVSNPPYVPSGADLPRDVLAEPAVALFAGVNGDEILRRLVREAPEWLRSGGAIALEIGDATQVDVLPRAQVRHDITGRPRVVWARI